MALRTNWVSGEQVTADYMNELSGGVDPSRLSNIPYSSLAPGLQEMVDQGASTYDGLLMVVSNIPHDITYIGYGKDTVRAVGAGDNPFGIRLARAITIKAVHYRALTADASGSLVVELRKNGGTVAGTSTTIAAANQVSGAGQSLEETFAVGDILTVHVTSVGSTPGKGLVADIKAITEVT